MEHHFNWFNYLPFSEVLPVHLLGSSSVAIILLSFAGIARLRLASVGNVLVPDRKLSFLNAFEMVAEGLLSMCERVLGKDGKRYFPLVGTIFLYILFSNLLGLIPGFTPPTDNMNKTLACGLFVFFYYNIEGIRSGGLSYLKHFLGPVWYMAWLLLPIEIISHMVRPLSLGLRLSGNMQGDHMILNVMTDLAPFGLIIPIPFYFLGFLICFIQAFVFSLLTMVYIVMARETAH